MKRHASGYRPLTEFGEQMLPFAERVEHAVQTFEQHKQTIERGDTGVVRLTCPEPIMYRITQAALLDRFHAKHPGLRVEFVMSDKYLDISKGTPTSPAVPATTDDAVLVGKKIADSIWAVYASKSYIARHGQPANDAELRQHAIVGFDGDGQTPCGRMACRKGAGREYRRSRHQHSGPCVGGQKSPAPA